MKGMNIALRHIFTAYPGAHNAINVLLRCQQGVKSFVSHQLLFG